MKIDLAQIDKLSHYALILSVFFLPVNTFSNSFLLLIFICLQLIKLGVDFNKTEHLPQKWKLNVLLLSAPFIITLLGTLYSSRIEEAIGDTIRILPLAFLPLIFVKHSKQLKPLFDKIFIALTLGCVLAAIICWVNSFYLLMANSDPLFKLFRPEYANRNLTEILDIHPSYLGIMVSTSIAYLVYVLEEKKEGLIRKQLIYLIIFVLVIFLLHLLARSAILGLLIGLLVYIIARKKYKALLVLITTLFLAVVIIQSIDHNYLRDRLFNSLNFFAKKSQFDKKDDRFNRLKASYYVFLEHPIIGPGTSDEDLIRRKYYKENRDVVAYNRGFNAHNQFFEYLSTYGLIGGLAFISLFFMLFKLALRQPPYLFLFIVFIYFLGCITESLMERSAGIVYFSIFTSLLFALSFERSKKPLK